MELCRRRPGSRQEGTVEETAVNTPLTVTGTIADIHTKTGQTMTGKAGVKDVPVDHLTEKDATLTDEKEIMQTAGKDPEARETAKAVPLKEEALPEHPAETHNRRLVRHSPRQNVPHTTDSSGRANQRKSITSTPGCFCGSNVKSESFTGTFGTSRSIRIRSGAAAPSTR